MPQAGADRTELTTKIEGRYRRRRPLHVDMSRPTLIFRPTADELAIYGRSRSYGQAFGVLKPALDDDILMVALRRIRNGASAHRMTDLEVLEGLARAVADGRMLMVSRPTPPRLNPDRYVAARDKDYRALLAGPFDGAYPFMYLDARANVMVGVGRMLPTPSAAHLINFVRRQDRSRPTMAKVTAAYMAVRSSLANRQAQTYRRLTDLDLAPGEADRMLDQDLERAEDDCRKLFGGWATFPLPAQLALLDMVHNPGDERPLSAAEKWAGQRERRRVPVHQSLRAKASAKAAWLAASRQCQRLGVSDVQRILWTRDQLHREAAPHRARRGFDPHRSAPASDAGEGCARSRIGAAARLVRMTPLADSQFRATGRPACSSRSRASSPATARRLPRSGVRRCGGGWR